MFLNKVMLHLVLWYRKRQMIRLFAGTAFLLLACLFLKQEGMVSHLQYWVHHVLAHNHMFMADLNPGNLPWEG